MTLVASRDSLWIIVLSYNGLDDTRKCLKSLASAIRPDVIPLLVDNGSTDGTGDAVEAEFPWCRVLRVQQNRGPAAGNNAGIRTALSAGGEWILLLNNDTVVSADLVERLRAAAAAHPEFSIIGPVIKFMDDPDVVMTDGCIFNPVDAIGFFQRQPVPLTEGTPPAIIEVDVVNGCCMLLKADVLRRIGLFDERMFIYHDELDLCLRATAAGYKAGVIDHALVWHKGSATSGSTGKRTVRYFDARNLIHVLRRHGARPRRRSRLPSAVMYARYMYYWYCAEREQGHEQSANAVVEGISDGLIGRTGPYTNHPRLLAGPIRLAFELMRRVRHRIPAPSSS